MNENGKAPNRTGFRARVFVSFGVFLWFFAGAASGIILFLRPEGSLASWAGWHVLGIDKKGWEGVHILSVIMFVVFAAAHLRFNGSALAGYIRRRAADGRRLRKEHAAAALTFVVILAAAITRQGPLWKIVEIRSDFKKGTHLVKVPPPVPDAETLSLPELASLVNVPLDDVLERLRRAGYAVDDPGTSLTDLARRRRTSPEKLFEIVLGP